MSGTGYRLLGLLVWNGGKWYLRRRLPSTRAVLLGGAGGLSALLAAGLIARRASA